MNVTTIMASLISVVIVALLIGLIASWPVMMLWNYCLVPAVTGLHQIEWLQAFGLVILFHMLLPSATVKK